MPHNLSMRWLVHAERMNLQTRMRMRWWGRTTKGMRDGFAGRRIAGVWRTRRKRRVRQRIVFAGRIEALKSVWNGESDVAVGPSP